MKKNISKKLFKFATIFVAGFIFSGVAFSEELNDENANSTTQALEIENKTEDKKEEDVLVLTVEDAVKFSTENSLSLKTSEIDLQIAKLKKDNAWNIFIPTVNLSGTLSRSNDIESQIKSATQSVQANQMIYGTLGGITGDERFIKAAQEMQMPSKTESMHWAAVGNLSIQFNFNISMIQSMRVTIASYEAGLITYEDAVKSNENNVRTLFYGLLLQQESLKLKKDNLENARQRMNQAQVNYQNGYVPQIQYLQAQVSYENQVPTVEKAELSVRQSIDSFAFLLGLPIGVKIELKGKIDPVYIDLDVEEFVKTAKANNLTICSLKKNLQTAKLSATALELSTYIPSVSIGWNGQPMITDAFKSDWGKKDNWNDKGALSLTLAWNLTNMLPFSSTSVSIKELKANIEKAKIKLETLERNTELEVRKAADTLTQCKRSLEISERNIQLAQKSFDMTWQAYKNGTTEYLDLVEAETQLNQAKLGLVNEKYNYMTSVMALEKLLNCSLTGGR